MLHSKMNPIAWLASLRLTVVLLALAMYLIFVGTLAQVEQGIWQVVHDYFRSWIVFVPLDVFRALLYPGSETQWKGSHPFPGGFLVIALLLINLLAAHALRFKITGKGGRLVLGLGLVVVGSAVTAYTVLEPTTSATIQQNVMLMLGIWSVPMTLIGVGCIYIFSSRKAGIVLIHAGLILMLLGEYITGLGAEEGRMMIPEFGSANVVVDAREVEIAFVTDSDNTAATQKNIVIPEAMIQQADESEELITDPLLPVSVRIDAWMANSDLRPSVAASDPTEVSYTAIKTPTATGTEMAEDRPTVMATLYQGEKRLGQYLLSTWEFVRPTTIEINGRRWQVTLRHKHVPLNYSLQLHDFKHDTFTGTERARNFSSDLRLVAGPQGEGREAFIKMNQPLRYDGKAFFQSGFFQQPLNRNLGTILQVADNPGAWVPYLSCVIVTVGLSMHFVVSLLKYGRRSVAKA